MSRERVRGWIADLAVGGIAGGVIGGIVAVNFVIYVGVDGGYEASISDVFRHNMFAGIVTVAILIAGPVVGVSNARRRRRESIETVSPLPDPGSRG